MYVYIYIYIYIHIIAHFHRCLASSAMASALPEMLGAPTIIIRAIIVVFLVL